MEEGSDGRTFFPMEEGLTDLGWKRGRNCSPVRAGRERRWLVLYNYSKKTLV